MTAWLALWLCVASPVLAQPVGDGTEQLGEGLIPGIPPGPPPPADEVEERAQAIARKLRCPVCQGLSVADSTSEAAVMFQRRIRELVAAGYTEDQVRDFFVDRYGEWILLDPEPRGLDAVLYLVPAILLGAGAMWVFGTVTAWRREPEAVAESGDAGVEELDDYERLLLQELDE